MRERKKKMEEKTNKLRNTIGGRIKEGKKKRRKYKEL